MFNHEERDIKLVIHGDDLTLLGREDQLDWFKGLIKERFVIKEIKERFEIKDDKSIRILNRIGEWSSEGIKYEADQRHAEIIVNELGLKGESRSSNVPGEKRESNTEVEDSMGLDKVEATRYRRLAARGVYLTQYRSDIGFSVKEIERGMSRPNTGDQKLFKKLG